VGDVRFAGVPIKTDPREHGVTIDPQVKYVTAEGHAGSLGAEKPDVEHSIPVADVLERGMLALRLNGEPIPGIHGGPVRLVTPGLFGTMEIKWLRRLRFETEPLCLVRVEDRADTHAWHLRDLGPSHRLSGPQPTARRQDLLEPQRLRVDRRVQGRRDRRLKQGDSTTAFRRAARGVVDTAGRAAADLGAGSTSIDSCSRPMRRASSRNRTSSSATSRKGRR
jgi:DMSO/TMAO reductase YedYZ molybdopterin-dependent catalytic subunit